MKKKALILLGLLFVFTLSLTITVVADGVIQPPCCTYHFTINGVDCWTGGQWENGVCVQAEPTINNPCWTGEVDCAEPIPVGN